MGCLKLHIEDEPILRLAYSKKEVKPSKKVGRYYPFGLEQKGYNNVVNGTENNYQTFQGQELEEELGKNTLAYQWRDYDPAIARFNKVDRFAEKYYSISNYAFTANNPILYHEIAGDSIGAGREHYDRFRQNAVDKRQRILDRRERQLDRARERGNDDKVERLTERFNTEDADANSDISRLNQTITELDALENSEQVYNLVTNSPDVVGNQAGNITYDTATGEVNVNVANGYTSGLFAHELKHAYQFETGKLSFGLGGNGGLLYDIQDEVEAYKRGTLFGEASKTVEQIRQQYPGLRGRETQRTLESRLNVPGATFREVFEGMDARGSANRQIYIRN